MQWAPALAAALMAAAALTGCEDSEVVAPDGATVSLSANPAQIVLINGIQDSDVPVELIATVRSEIGVPLPGQDVRFETTSGVLSPKVGTPVSTDGYGNARSTLTLATSGPTITATSGKATDTLTLTAATGLLATIQLTPSTFTVNNCSDKPTFIATALDPDGQELDAVSLEIFVTNANLADVPIITFPDSPGQTGANSTTGTTAGQVKFTLNFDQNDCNDKCGSGKSCQAILQVRNLGGTVVSNTSTMTDAI
jgi:hypothetical protein